MKISRLLFLLIITGNMDVTIQSVTACLVGNLLKDEILDSSNAKRINNLHGGVSEGAHVRG